MYGKDKKVELCFMIKKMIKYVSGCTDDNLFTVLISLYHL